MKKEFTVPSHINVLEDVGESICFNVEKTNGNEVNLKYIERPKFKLKESLDKSSSLRQIFTKGKLPLDKQALQQLEYMKDKEKEYIEIVNNTKNQIEKVLNKTIDHDIRALINESYNPEKITIELFEKIITNNKRAVKNNNIEKIQEEANKEVNKEIEKIC